VFKKLKEKMMTIQRKLLIFGTALFLLGLFNGVVIQTFYNPRMGLSAHLAAVQNALVLWALGLMWSHVSLSKRMESLTAWASIYGMYAIWLGLVLAGVFGASKSLPIAGAGFVASASVEVAVQILVYSGSLASIVGTALLLAGLLKKT
jgi:hydroxylaminobenzene mutase